MNKRVSTDYKTYLSEDELPTHYYNLRADMKTDHAPMLNPKTLKPVTVEDLEPVFATELAKQELNTTDRFIPIPEPVRDFYKMYRPSPLVHAEFLEKRSTLPPRSTTNSKATIPAVLINLIRLLRRHIMPSNRD